MKKLLDKRVSVKSVLAFLLLLAVMFSSIAALPTKIQVTLSPDITVKYNGVTQTMKDVDGNTVYPLLYQGTTYVPIRAVSNMLSVPVDWDGETRTVLLGTKEEKPSNDSEFDFAYFDVIVTGDNAKTAILGLIMRFHGEIDTIDPADFTDIVLTRDGTVVDNAISYSGKLDSNTSAYGNVTDFYFLFKTENRIPGNYGLTGRYKGEPFTVYNKILEKLPIGDQPADPDKFRSMGYGGWPDKNGDLSCISSFSFYFSGVQQAFFISDLTDLSLTLNGKDVLFSFEGQTVRYLEHSNEGPETIFHLALRDSLTGPGTYLFTGNYRGRPFTSTEMVVPEKKPEN